MIRSRLVALAGIAVLWACGGGDADQAADDAARDLSLAPAESIAALNDRPQQAPATQPQRQTPPAQPRTPAPRSLGAGTALQLMASDTITSRRHKPGDPVRATSAADIKDSRGRTVIPAGATFSGAIAEIDAGGDGTLLLAFDRVSFGGHVYAVVAESDSVGTVRQGRGVTAGDAAKVGAGAAAGAIAGRIIGKDTKGAVIGGVVGAAAGAGVAAATKGDDLVLPAGAPIRIVLRETMVLRPVT